LIVFKKEKERPAAYAAGKEKGRKIMLNVRLRANLKPSKGFWLKIQGFIGVEVKNRVAAP